MRVFYSEVLAPIREFLWPTQGLLFLLVVIVLSGWVGSAPGTTVYLHEYNNYDLLPLSAMRLLPDGICMFASYCDWTKSGRTKHKLYPQLMNFRQRSIIMVHKVKSLNAFHCVSMITGGRLLAGRSVVRTRRLPVDVNLIT